LTKKVSFDTLQKMNPSHPSHKTITGKVKLAKDALKGERLFYVDVDIIAADLSGINRDMSELPDILNELLEKADYKNYTGTRPPQKSYEAEINGCELFAFTVESRLAGCTMYFKFTLQEDVLWLVSLHREKPTK
jgi:hypothetical protein